MDDVDCERENHRIRLGMKQIKTHTELALLNNKINTELQRESKT